ncbi:MAG: hypothetical protein FWG79_04245 [Bacteroidales bacterium]|nr:hypothetical protein [Bacteroidales bacterium]
MQKVKIAGLIIFLGIVFMMESCRKDPIFNTDPNFRLEFSVGSISSGTIIGDTVRFDTVFTSLGSTTLLLKVYNRSDKDVNIQTIELVGGENSPFRINVNGDTSLLQTNVRLRAKDSMFIFVRVTIDPDDKTKPFLELDSIRFLFNNRSQYVILEAFGQNAIYHLPTERDFFYNGDTLRLRYSIANVDTFATSLQTHVIYGYLLVQEELILNAGTRLHFAPNSGLIIAEGGSLKVNGSHGNEVIFEGMRMDNTYHGSVTGQWDRIWFLSGSVGNHINWAIVRNGKIGFLMDSMPHLNSPLIIENTIIDNMQSHGIFTQHSAIRGNNLQVSNCGECLLALHGGDYIFEHCTFANYFSSPNFIRRMPSVVLDSTSLHPLSRADFTSCIIYGSISDELELRFAWQNSPVFRFDHCLIRTRINASGNNFVECKINPPGENIPYFQDPASGNFHIDSQLSAAFENGKPYPNVLYDLNDRERNRYRPTIGALEFQSPDVLQIFSP